MDVFNEYLRVFLLLFYDTPLPLHSFQFFCITRLYCPCPLIDPGYHRPQNFILFPELFEKRVQLLYIFLVNYSIEPIYKENSLIQDHPV